MQKPRVVLSANVLLGEAEDVVAMADADGVSRNRFLWRLIVGEIARRKGAGTFPAVPGSTPPHTPDSAQEHPSGA